MKWTLYVSDNEESITLLNILKNEPNERLKMTLKDIKIPKFGNSTYIENGKKRINDKAKILAQLLLRPVNKPTSSSAPVITHYPESNYEESIYSHMYNGKDEDDEVAVDKIKQNKEEIDRRATEMMSSRENNKPPPRVADPQLEKEKLAYSVPLEEVDHDEEISKYFQQVMDDKTRD